MATALYRRYRPERFADVIGQEHVTEPLMQALRTGRVNHAYLFSGPRGCGKTTSARILARCLNCAQGPTPTPCGVCDSCVALARGGAGSVDVIEIDAASHGGVDDARDLRERASYGPAQSRYKIYIIDEAHMVTPQGFNALLKIVEEPPEHVKFIFATTEPEKVIGTIRSRTHHYPFRLVPPARLGDYMQKLCDQEGVAVAHGVLSFVTRAGGGSVRDSLSVLDQLIAGSGDEGLTYDSAVSLLGFTDGELLDATIDALAARDGAATFRQIDKVIESGHDPRRFIEDLLERLRDLIIVAAIPEGAAQVLRGTPEDQLERLRGQQAAFGQGTLSRAADIVNAGLTEMTGANSPRLQLELICARILLPAASGEQGYAARLDRLERRLDVGGVPSAARGSAGSQQQARGAAPGGMPQSAPPAGSGPGAPSVTGPGSAPTRTAPTTAPSRTVTDRTPPHASVTGSPDRTSPTAGGMGGAGRSEAVERLVGADPSGSSRQNSANWSQPPASSTSGQRPERPAGQHDAQQIDRARSEAGGAPVATPSQSVGGPSAVGATGGAHASGHHASDTLGADESRGRGEPSQAGGAASDSQAAGGAASGGMDTDAIRRAWPDVLGRISGMRRATWTFVSQHAQVMAYDGRTLTLGIGTVGLTNTFRSGNHAELVRQALIDELGVDAIVDGIPLPEPPTEAASAAGAPASGGWSAGSSAATEQGQPRTQPPSGQSGPPPGSGGGAAPRRDPAGAPPGRSLENNPGWANVTAPAPDWASAPPSTGAGTPAPANAPAAGATHGTSTAPSAHGGAGAPDPEAPKRGAKAVRESLAGARSGARKPDEPAQKGRDDLGDDSAVSDDDENIEVSGDVGRTVVERVFGGRVLSESDD